ncbi:MAG: hypothetical protein JWN38_867 [Candidatus Saccharibacteria bacterium]|nr:hypothetical protein [Candidatus Saccharibacteria bacterium]
MINLLPPEIKAEYSYARQNVSLRKWALTLFVALLGVGALATYGLLNMQASITSNQKQVSQLSSQLQQENLSQTESQVKNISSSLKLAAQVISKEVLFSKLITQIGAAMPSGSVLTTLNINQTSGGLDLTAKALDYQTASQVQVNLASPQNKIFAKADLVSINCDTTDTSSNYPCSVTLRTLFNAKNQFLFINQDATK